MVATATSPRRAERTGRGTTRKPLTNPRRTAILTAVRRRVGRRPWVVTFCSHDSRGDLKVFGGKRRVQQHAIAQLRVEVAAERHARDAQLAVLQAALVGAVARASDAEQCALHRLRVSAEQNTAEVAALLAQLAQTYAALIDSLEIARADRAALAETVQQLVEATYTL